MKRRPMQSGTLRFIFIAVVLMLLMDHFVFGGKRSYIEDVKTAKVAEKYEESLPAAKTPPVSPPVKLKPEQGEYFEFIPEEKLSAPWGDDLNKEGEAPRKDDVPPPLSPPPSEGKMTPRKDGVKRIAIIIDDVGMDVKHSKQAIMLPAPVTLAVLPYAPKAREMAAAARARGHELIIHTPMEAMDGRVNIGPNGLKAGMDGDALNTAFQKMLESFDGYVGINNHMGSRLTQDKDAMDRLMKILSREGLFFVDSKTIQGSVAAKEAAQAGIPYAERDVFLDHVESADFVVKALAHTEKLAQRRGYAIAIGHPKPFTIEGLKAWIPTLRSKGIELVPVSRLLVTPKVVSPAVIPSGAEESGQIPPLRDASVGMTEEGGASVGMMAGESEVLAPSTAPSGPESALPEGLNLRLRTQSPAP